jgi:hypothetical protein
MEDTNYNEQVSLLHAYTSTETEECATRPEYINRATVALAFIETELLASPTYTFLPPQEPFVTNPSMFTIIVPLDYYDKVLALDTDHDTIGTKPTAATNSTNTTKPTASTPMMATNTTTTTTTSAHVTLGNVVSEATQIIEAPSGASPSSNSAAPLQRPSA